MIKTNSTHDNKFSKKKLLCVDYGLKVCGLAFYHVGVDPYSYPFGRIVRQNDHQVIQDLSKIIQGEEIDVVILGIPILPNGQESYMTKKVKKFALELLNHLDPDHILYLQDETLSTFEAKERMKSSPRYNFRVNLKEIDALAANIILEDFLGSQDHNQLKL